MIERLTFYVTHSLNDLRANRQRTAFALLCIASGVAAIVGLQTLGELINDTLTGSLREANKSDIAIFSGPPDDATETVQQQGRDEGVIEPGGQFFADYFGPAGLARIESWFADHYPGQAALTYQQTFSDLTTGAAVSVPARQTEKTFVSSYIVDADVFPLYGERVAEDGTPLRDLLREPDDIVISRNLADDLGATVGDRLRISGASADFTLRGIVPTDAEAGIDNLFAGMFGYYYLDRTAAGFFAQEPATYDVYVRLEDSARLDEVAAAFRAEFPYLRVTTTEDLADRNAQAARLINGLVTVMGLVSLLIGGIGIVNTMLVIVNRRTTEIAILKTVGLEPGQVTLLFLTEALLMGVIGGLGGIGLGWIIAYIARSIAETFVAQSLDFRLMPGPALTGFAVGLVITAIFGFLPTLAAGRVRPAIVLRPSEAVVPQAGRLAAVSALLVMLAALSVLVQGLIGGLIGLDAYRGVTGLAGLLAGGLIAASLGSNGTVPRAVTLGGPPLLGLAIGYAAPVLLVLAAGCVLLGLLYVTLWALIWALGGGELHPRALTEDWPGWAWLLAALLLPVAVILLLPLWVLWGSGRLIQRFGWVDLRIAMRAMVATRGRGATTLMALVVGVFTLSLLTMLVDSITRQFETMLEREAGGNVLVLSTGRGPVLDRVETTLVGLDGVRSYAVLGSYNARLVAAEGGVTGAITDWDVLRARAREDTSRYADLLARTFEGIDARELGSNLPEVDFYRGRQLTPADAGQPVVVIEANEATLAAGLDVGDRLTFELIGQSLPTAEETFPTVTLEVVGMVDRRGGSLQLGGSASYAPAGIFPPGQPPDQVTAVVDIEPKQVAALRQAMAEIPGTFVLETRFLNGVINRLIDQFTGFPLLVAGLALFTGGVVIANSVALSALERRREIAIMKAVGLQRERVLGMLLLENALLGAIGGLIGVGIGVLLLVALLFGFFGGALGDAIPVGTALALMGLCVLIALAAALLSVWGTSGEKPINALRYQ